MIDSWMLLHEMADIVGWAYDRGRAHPPLSNIDVVVDGRDDSPEQFAIVRYREQDVKALVIPGTQDVHDALLPDGHEKAASILELLDMDAFPVEVASGVKVHRGAYRMALNLLAVPAVADCQFVIGHSLGAAAAAGIVQAMGVFGIGFAPLRYYAGRCPPDMSSRFLSVVRSDDLIPTLPLGGWSLPGLVHILPATPGASILERHAIGGYRDLLLAVGQ